MTGTAESSASPPGNQPLPERKRRPVFVIGCHRSGTNLLYDTLLSAGGFAIYRGYLPIYEILQPHFGSLANSRHRQETVDAFLRSNGFRRAGVEPGPLSAQLMSECRNAGDFLRVVMEKIAQSQGAPRWAVYDPDNVLHITQIRRDIPDPLFVHIIRDGRDVAFSLMKMEGFHPFPRSARAGALLETALYWQWMVQQGRQQGRLNSHDYVEVHYEELVTQPRAVLAELGRFLDHDLDYDRIQSTGLGRLRESNSSFRGDEKETKNPVNRWKEKLTQQQVAALEFLIGPTLQACGYPLTLNVAQERGQLQWKLLSALYPRFLATKHWLKVNTPMGRLSDLSALELQSTSADAEHP
jgi:LPS sulfotransferase NodH